MIASSIGSSIASSIASLAASSLMLAAVLTAAACETPTPTLKLGYAGPPSQECNASGCGDLDLKCPAVMMIRIVDPSDPATRYLDQCEDVSLNPRNDMCALNTVDLAQSPIPVQPVEVQVAVYPRSMVPRHPVSDVPLCPDIAFSANGFPVEQAPTPALGGHAFYHPGDSVVEVTLGCTDLAALEQACEQEREVQVSATVESFTAPPILVTTNSNSINFLRVGIGEPKLDGARHALKPETVKDLLLSNEVSPAVWKGLVPFEPVEYACIEVQEDTAMTSAVLRCQHATAGEEISMGGVWMRRDVAEEISDWLSAHVPAGVSLDDGVTIGLVLDQDGRGAPGYTVTAAGATVLYRASDGKGASSATSELGLFASFNAPFGTEFSARSVVGPATGRAIGGAVLGKITVVILTAGEQQ